MRGEREFGRLLSSRWIKVPLPLLWLITTTERDVGRKREIKGGRDLGGEQLTPLMAGLLCALGSVFRSEAHTKHSLDKALKSAADTRYGVSGGFTQMDFDGDTRVQKKEQRPRANYEKGRQHVENSQLETKLKGSVPTE